MSETATTPDVVEGSPSNIGGRPTVKTPERREKILAEIRVGTPKTCAAVYCGIGRSTFHEWEKEDADFREAIEDAEQAYYESLRKKVEKGRMASGKVGDWRAAAWILERRDRQNYGDPKQASSVTVNNTSNLTVIVTAEQIAATQAEERQALEALLHARN